MNNVNLMGRLTKDPELRRTESGNAVTRFTIAVNRKYDRDKADFINCTAFKGTAEFIRKYFKKGEMIALSGRLQIDEWTDKDGNKRTAPNVVADNVYFCGSKNTAQKAETVEYDTDGDAWQELEDDTDSLPF